jgi:3-dehydroquinate synthase
MINFVLRTNLPVSSRVAVGDGALQEADRLLQQCEIGKRILVLCQPSTRQLFANPLVDLLSAGGYDVDLMELPDGEACKEHSVLLDVWSRLQDKNFGRADCLLAVGGGAVSDLAGFAASTYLRGIKLVLVPTTLLAQVDAAIGGKTGINLPAGKNLAGTFYFPSAILVDPQTLRHLPERQMRSGFGEIIKYALIESTVLASTEFRGGPRSLLAVLQDAVKEPLDCDNPSLAGIITACIKMKLAVVAKDPQEGRLRRCLNLGHTLGHAIEKISNYGCTHGEAVAIGLVFACRLAERLAKLPAEQTAVLIQLLQAAQLPTTVPEGLPKERLVETMKFDKKRVGQTIKFVLPAGVLGNVELDADVHPDNLLELL